MRDPVDRVVRAVARRNSYALIWAQFGLADLVILGGVGLLWLCQRLEVGLWAPKVVASRAADLAAVPGRM